MSAPAELELVAPIDAQLVSYAEKTGLAQSSTAPLVEAFRPLFVEARVALQAAVGVVESVKDATCVSEIRQARACRLAIRRIRIDGEKIKKAQKANALTYGRAVDGFYNILEADLAPVEKALQDAEDTAERAEQARKDALEVGRKAALAPYVADVSLYPVREMNEAMFAALLTGVKVAKEQAEAAAAKAEADRIAAEKARQAEEARIREENARLAREAKEREEAARLEREKAAAEKAALEAAAKAERETAAKAKADAEAREKAAQQAAAAALKAEQDRLNAIAAAERAKAAKAAEEAAAKAKAEREAIEAANRKEKLRLQALAEVERQKTEAARAKAESDAHLQRVAREKLEAEIKAAKEAEAEAAKKAAAAPDREKLLAIVARMKAERAPDLTTDAAQVVQAEFASQWFRLAGWLETKAGAL